jgi:uncharacterized protein (DUF58 family)
MFSETSIAPELIAKVKKIQLKTKRKLSADLMGQYRSAFKGTGLTFSELREYQPGDDSKHIHWKATARSTKTYVKSYEEERSLNILLVLDVSTSTNFGTEKSKHEAAIEFAALIAYLALAQKDSIGLCTFTDKIENYFPPKQSRHLVQQIIKYLLAPKTFSPKTNISTTLKHLNEIKIKNFIIFVISDFISPDYQDALSVLAVKNDIVLVKLVDMLDYILPKAGIVIFQDPESGHQLEIDTSNKKSLEYLLSMEKDSNELWKKSCRKIGVDYIFLNKDPLTPLIELMNKRTRRS